MAPPMIKLNGRLVRPGQPCLVIAEAGVNHNGSLEMALNLVEAAARAGAEVVKFQTFRAEEVASAQAAQAAYQRTNTGLEQSQVEMLRGLELPEGSYPVLMERCRRLGIGFLSTAFDAQSADMLESLGMTAFKVPSGEITNFPLLAHLAAKGRPIILSTGMSSLPEVHEAVELLQAHGARELALLHCVSNYPAQPGDVNLRAMASMAQATGLPVGYSDHVMGNEVALAAVALGACVIEKHFTLDRGLPGPDHLASAEPDELAALVKGVRVVEACLGHGRKEPAASEEETRQVARRSLVAAVDIPAGTRLTAQMITLKRPGTGLPPRRARELWGLEAKQDIPAGTLLSLEMLA